MARDPNAEGRITSLDGTQLACFGPIVEAIGIPVYVSDVAEYAEYELEESGWYLFARVKPLATANNMRSFARINSGHTSMLGTGHANVTVDGAAGYVVGPNYVDVAVRFEVAAQSCEVTIHWGTTEDKIIFRATDLAVRNLDYLVTFYVYDLAPYCDWQFTLATDATFDEAKHYYVPDGEGGYVLAPVGSIVAGDPVPTVYYERTDTYAPAEHETAQSGTTYYVLGDGGYVAAEVTTGDYLVPYEDAYALTEDETFQDKTYYVLSDGEYVEASGTLVGDPVPPDTYYEHSYVASEDETFAEGKTYYKRNGSTYTTMEVTAGETIPTYHERTSTYAVTDDEEFAEGTIYCTKSGTTYSEATVTPGDQVPTFYYVHSKLVIDLGAVTQNVTYRLDVPVDCPSEFELPAVEDDGHGCWFEMRFLHDGSYSSTLTPPSSDVKVATEHTQAESKGINMVDLHYSAVAGSKVWRFLNTHSTFTADTPALESIEFRAAPTTTEYEVGGTLSTTGAEVVATYVDGHKKLVTASVTFLPANGATLTEDDTELTATLTAGDITATATTPITVTPASAEQGEGGEPGEGGDQGKGGGE